MSLRKADRGSNNGLRKLCLGSDITRLTLLMRIPLSIYAL